MDDTTKLLTLADACSDVLLGGEQGWERMDFSEFVGEVRKAIAYGVHCKVTGLIPPEREKLESKLEENTREIL